MEIYILKLLTSEHGDKRHFTAIVDRAKKTSFFFLVMDLVGKSLEELIEETPSKVRRLKFVYFYHSFRDFHWVLQLAPEFSL
jgi:hypothetical protein